MTELTLETLRTELQAALEPIRAQLVEHSTQLAEQSTQLRGHSAQLVTLNSEVKSIRAHVDGLPIIGVSVHDLRQDMCMMRAAINDLAREHITAGEVVAIHDDLNRVQTKQMELETRIATLEREVHEP
jgi:chromosome segregation ATPase